MFVACCALFVQPCEHVVHFSRAAHVRVLSATRLSDEPALMPLLQRKLGMTLAYLSGTDNKIVATGTANRTAFTRDLEQLSPAASLLIIEFEHTLLHEIDATTSLFHTQIRIGQNLLMASGHCCSDRVNNLWRHEHNQFHGRVASIG